MDPKDLVLLLTGVLNILLSGIVFLRNRKNQVNLSLAFFTLSLAGWALGILLFRNAANYTSAIIWAKVYYIAASSIAASILYFASVFPEGKPPSHRMKFLIGLPALLHGILLLIPGYLTHDIILSPSGNEVILGKPEYAIYTLYFLPLFYGALYLLWSKYQTNTGILKRQILLVLISVFAASIFGVVFNLVLPWFGNYRLIYLGPPFTMIIFGILAYSILTHRLLDFKLSFIRLMVHVMVITLVAALYSIIVYSLTSVLLINISEQMQIIIGTGLTFLFALAFQPIRNFLESISSSVLYYRPYDLNQLFLNLSKVMSTNIEPNTLVNEIVGTLVSGMKVSRGLIVLIDDKTVTNTFCAGFENKPNFNYESIFKFLNYEESVVFDDLNEGEVKQKMRELNISIFRVLKIKDEIIGILMLGEKAFGEIYTNEDLRFLKLVGPEISLAVLGSSLKDTKESLTQMTQEVYKMNAKLHELDRLKDDFVSVASHELRTPMTAIRSYAWMALYRSDIPLSDKLKKYLGRTLVSTERLINLVNDMLNISRIESGRVEINPSAFDIQALAKDVAAEVEPKSKEKNLKITITSSNIPQVFADPDKIHQVLLNLVGNALKFTPSGGNIKVSFFSDGKILETSVKDSGVGISQIDLSRLFKKFSRLDNSYVASATSGGTGLGLYICKSLVELMQGRIWANSEGQGKGATFTFSLPVATTEVLAQAEKYTKKASGESKPLEPTAI